MSRNLYFVLLLFHSIRLQCIIFSCFVVCKQHTCVDVFASPRQAFCCVLHTVCGGIWMWERRIIINGKKDDVNCVLCLPSPSSPLLLARCPFSFYFYSHSLSSVWILFIFIIVFCVCISSKQSHAIHHCTACLCLLSIHVVASKRNRLHWLPNEYNWPKF